MTFTQTINAAGRLTQVTSSLVDAQHPATLATVDASVGYHPHGAIKKMLLGNGLTETAAYNNRLQPCRINVNSSGTLVAACTDPQPTGNVQDFNYGFGHGTADNGNVASWAAVGAQNFSRSYTYDELNRLKTMTGTGGTCTGLEWTYDIWANRTNQTTAPGGGACGEHHPTILTNNRLSGLGYDAAGNVTSDPATNATYTYDAENRMISANGTLGNATYIYDADGGRIRKTASGVTTDYIYDLGGSVIAEKQGSTWTVGYIYVNGQLVAQYDNTLNPATTLFVHKDHLGSTRLMTKLDQSVHDSLDYLPYGEQIAGDTGSTHKFTSKERDAETNLDYFGARYYASALGRFPTGDPSMQSVVLRFPQSWNRYSYTLNNPLRYIDPTGEVWVATGNDSGPYTWQDTCGEGQTCYDSVAAQVDGQLTIYGSNGADDITPVAAEHGMVDLQTVAAHHDAQFELGTDIGDAHYATSQTAADFYNATQESHQTYEDDSKIVVTQAGNADGTKTEDSKFHGDGYVGIDVRYMGKDGKPIAHDPNAVDKADLKRNQTLIDAVHSRGFNKNYSGSKSLTNTQYDAGHKSHLHLGKDKPPSN